MGKKVKIVEILVIAFDVVPVALAICMAVLAVQALWKNPVKTIQDLLKIYDMETHIGAVAIGILVCGGLVLIFIVGTLPLFKCCSKKKDRACCKYTFTAFLIPMCVAYLVFGFLSATYNCEFDDGLEMTLNKSLNDDYIDGRGIVAKAWDKVQFELSCCGVFGPNDYADIKLNKGRYVPASCCKRRDTHYQSFNETICQDEADLLQHKQFNNGTFLNTAGCYSEMKNTFHKYLLKMMRFSFGMCGVLVICVVVTFYIICIS